MKAEWRVGSGKFKYLLCRHNISPFFRNTFVTGDIIKYTQNYEMYFVFLTQKGLSNRLISVTIILYRVVHIVKS